MTYYLGVDAGNSKTLAMVCTATGEVVGFGRSGNGDIYGAATADTAVDTVLAAIASTSIDLAEVDGAAFRLAGIDWPADEAFWRKQLADKLPDLRSVTIENDGFAAIRCGSLSGIGLGIVVGTGNAVAGRGPKGTSFSASFWIQEENGAAGLGAAALRAVFHEAAGIGPATTLTPTLLAHFGQDDAESLLELLTAREGPREPRDRPVLAPLVTRAAASGDAVAREIVTEMAERLADYTAFVARRVGYAATDPMPIVLAGSVVAGGECVADAIAAALPRQLPNAHTTISTLPPIAGATLDALAESSVELTEAIVDELRATIPTL
ncbi:N-acetylglucosamine kinase [Tenggerimyces flavus]|uniref:N-acetylglucosamine kinase n=1 Tax=Tenggerimyces flavus TaxID=1708749 RepID=A0ABV7YHQ7_9ACTN|nr:BadF/BadG/BcrA/BcrD ATPase family protein [Tenggerimyces flavus]MBM7784110.1 N-acetylglucosamine kinase-like BadF-type ATPase [Tenggerimyces flavus]